MLYIIFCGNDHVGKTTMANSLFRLVTGGFRKIPQILSYADGVREELVDYYGLPKDLIFNKKINKNDVTIKLGDYKYSEDIPSLWEQYDLIDNARYYDSLEISLRDLFVNHGTKIRRQQDELYWAKKLKVNEDHPLSIIDDARSPSDFIIDKCPLIFHLYNDMPITNENAEQTRMNEWLSSNKDKLTQQIKVSIPLTHYEADQINKTTILPHIRHVLT